MFWACWWVRVLSVTVLRSRVLTRMWGSFGRRVPSMLRYSFSYRISRDQRSGVFPGPLVRMSW